MPEKLQPKLSDLQRRISKFGPAISRLQNLEPLVGGIIEERGLKDIKGLDYISETASKTSRVASIKSKISQSSIPILVEKEKSLREEMETRALSEYMQIKDAAHAGVWPETVLQQAKEYFIEAFGHEPKGTNHQNNQEDESSVPILRVDQEARVLEINEVRRKFSDSIISTIFWELADKHPISLTREDIAKLIFDHGFKSTTPVSMHITNLKNTLKKWLPDASIVEIDADSPTTAYKLSTRLENIKKEETPHYIELDPEMDIFLNRIPTETSTLIRNFLRSPQSERIINGIRNFNSTDVMQIKDFNGRLAGTLFEQLGYQQMIQKYSSQKDVKVISPSDVLNIYGALHPEKGVSIYEGEFNVGIHGVSVPDGLILQDTETNLRVIGVIEYKMWVQSITARNLEDQLRHFRYESLVREFFRVSGTGYDQMSQAKALNEHIPDLPIKPLSINPHLQIIYALPENSSVVLPADVSKETIRVNSMIFAHFLDLLVLAANRTSTEERVKEETISLRENEPEAEIIDEAKTLEQLDPDVKDTVRKLANKVYSFPSRTKFGQQLASYGVKFIDNVDITYAEARGLISPSRNKGNPSLTREEIAILLYYKTEAGHELTRDQIPEMKTLIATEFLEIQTNNPKRRKKRIR